MKANVLRLVLLGFVACASVGFGIDIRGVLYTGSYNTSIDSLIFTGRVEDTVRPTGWAADSMQYDTFDFVHMVEWPTRLMVFGTFNGSSERTVIPVPAPDTWYTFPLTPTEPRLQFSVGGAGVEEQAPVATARLRAGASVFSGPVALVASLPVASRGVVEVFDGTGRLVRTLADWTFAAGEQRLVWDRCDAEGRKVGTGIYLARLSAGSSRSLAKLVLVD